jgi:hypothetical protein
MGQATDLAFDAGGGFGRRELERLLRYCARPPFAAERLEELDAQRLNSSSPYPCPFLILTLLE